MTDIKTLEEIKKQCFGLDDDELDTQIAYRDVIDVVGRINLYLEDKIKEELEQVVRVGLPYAKIRIKELEQHNGQRIQDFSHSKRR